MAQSENIQCSFSFNRDIEKYTCIIQKKEFAKDQKYLINYTNCADLSKVRAMRFYECVMPSIPTNFAWFQFKNLNFLSIHSSKLKEIHKSDLHGLFNVTELRLDWNELEYLPGDLFDDMNNLQIVSFYHNKIKHIEPELIDNLVKLKFINFRQNVNIFKSYDAGQGTIENVRGDILKYCKVPDHLRHTLMSKEAIVVEKEELFERFKSLKSDYEKVLSRSEILQVENSILKSENSLLSKLQFGASSDLKLAIKNEKFKDFTIIVDSFEFKVHKFLLMARSPVIANMILNNPDASVLQLLDIPKSSFEAILSFIYDDALPTNSNIFKDIFIISSRLEIEKLKNFAGEKLINQVDEKNSFEMLVLANTHKHHGLRLRAFEELKKLFPEIDLKQELAREPEKVRMLLDTRKKWEKMTEYIEEKYKKAN